MAVRDRGALFYKLDELWWDDEDATHIRTRSVRYPGATDIEPAWTLEAATDPHCIVRNADPKSYVGYTRIIGYFSRCRICTDRDRRP